MREPAPISGKVEIWPLQAVIRLYWTDLKGKAHDLEINGAKAMWVLKAVGIL